MGTRNTWRLTIEKDNGRLMEIHGSEELLRCEVDAWVTHERTTAGAWVAAEESGGTFRDIGGYLVRQVLGFSGDASRTEAVLAYRFRDVFGMKLEEI